MPLKLLNWTLSNSFEDSFQELKNYQELGQNVTLRIIKQKNTAFKYGLFEVLK